jgi:unsaturated chondroitin disaccharide hydrolase
LNVERAWRGWLEAAERDRERSEARDPDLYPHYSEHGRWILLPVERLSSWQDGVYEHGNWTAGFWFGVMWLLALGGDRGAAELARARLPRLAPRAADTTTHDLGFLFHPACVIPLAAGLLTEEDAAPAREAALTSLRRFNPRGAYLQAFGPIGDSRFAGTSTIDTMMNLPLLWWAAPADPALAEAARLHARTSARVFFRPDGSTYHLLHFDPTSGALLERGTFQGAGRDSCWSRGQAWAVAGFAWAHLATGEPELREAAERALDYFLDHLPSDGIPPWDFSDDAQTATPDASAAAVAALGAHLLERQATAADLLARLAERCLNREPELDGILLHSSYSKPHGLGIDGATAWGDFYFGLALALAAGALDRDALFRGDL